MQKQVKSESARCHVIDIFECSQHLSDKQLQRLARDLSVRYCSTCADFKTCHWEWKQ